MGYIVISFNTNERKCIIDKSEIILEEAEKSWDGLWKVWGESGKGWGDWGRLDNLGEICERFVRDL